MIDRVLNRGFVVRQARRLRREIMESAESATPELAALGKALADALDGSRDDDEDGTLEERKAYTPSNGVLSVLQTSLEDLLRSRLSHLLIGSPGYRDPGGPLGTEVVVRDFPTGDFTTTDPNWIGELTSAVLSRFTRGRFPVDPGRRPPDLALEADAVVVLLSDWATGAESARKVAAAIRTVIAETAPRPVHVIHLGDVYYAGSDEEIRSRFLEPWPVRADEEWRCRSYALNGNHEMYGGGWGYFGTLLADPRFWGQREGGGTPSSTFRLVNDDWQILGLDSAWDMERVSLTGEHGVIGDEQAAWLTACARERGGRRTILLSHHEPLSPYETLRGNLLEAAAAALASPGVDAWFWGHEHRCRTHLWPAPGLAYGACVGFGGMPQPPGRVAPAEGAWEYDEWRADADGDPWRLCGFAVIELTGLSATVRYVNEDGATIRGPEPL